MTMDRTLSQALLLGALYVSLQTPLLGAQAPTAASAQPNHATIALMVAGQQTTLADVQIVKGMPTGIPTPAAVASAPNPSTGGAVQSSSASTATPVQKPGELVAELPATPDSVSDRLADNQRCAKDKKNQACRVEGSITALGAAGSSTTSYLLHGAWVADLSLKGHKGDTAGRTGKVTIRYAALEATPVASPPAPMTTASAARLDSAPTKKHGGFLKSVGKVVKEHGLQVVEIATGVTMATAIMHSLALSRAASGGLTAGSQSQLASLARSINSTPGMHQVNLAQPTGGPAASSPASQAAYTEMVRRQLIAQGADSSRFTVTSGTQPATSSPGSTEGLSSTQLTSLAHMINASAGMHRIVVHPPASPSGTNDPAAQAAYGATVRQQLIAQGADSSRFTVVAEAQR
jgi:hypothetical protein